jgi:DNA-binding NtrC family response regulator
MTSRATILVVDDDPDVLTAARLLLRQHFGRVLTSDDPARIDELMSSEAIDVFLLDMNFAIGRNTGAEGLHWLQHVLSADPDAVVILMTAFGDLNTAVQAMREGATDFVLKPWQNDKLIATLSVAAKLRQTRTTVSALSQPPPVTNMIAESAAMKQVLKVVDRVAATDATVLIRGENGSGKELIAQALHRQSRRADKVLIALDLGAVAESLFESELFGHRQGAFTGADSDRAGRFLAADGGTLFLDEVGNLPPALQTKLLRVLESREVTPLGSNQPISVDVRLIAATNQPLEKMVDAGSFREDLLYRINTIEIELPPLRERPEDIAPLARRFMAQAVRQYQLDAKTITNDGLAALREHHWPGNVRELSHAIERAVLLSDGDALGAGDFRFTRRDDARPEGSLNLQANEKKLVELALEQSGGNVSHAAAALGITRAALYRRIEKFGL